jgi:sRNA-binding carbon storage regulator CsrA
MIEIGPGINIGGNIYLGEVAVPAPLLVQIINTEFYQDLQTESGLDLTTE